MVDKGRKKAVTSVVLWAVAEGCSRQIFDGMPAKLSNVYLRREIAGARWYHIAENLNYSERQLQNNLDEAYVFLLARLQRLWKERKIPDEIMRRYFD